jgi:hypothetical protein
MIFFFISVAKLWRSLVSSFSSPRISFSFFFYLMDLFDAETLELVCHPAWCQHENVCFRISLRKFTQIDGKFLDILPKIFIYTRIDNSVYRTLAR